MSGAAVACVPSFRLHHFIQVFCGSFCMLPSAFAPRPVPCSLPPHSPLTRVMDNGRCAPPVASRSLVADSSHWQPLRKSSWKRQTLFNCNCTRSLLASQHALEVDQDPRVSLDHSMDKLWGVYLQRRRATRGNEVWQVWSWSTYYLVHNGPNKQAVCDIIEKDLV